MIYFIEISSTKLKDPSDASDQPNAYIVEGYVKDDQGNPVSGATVTVKNTANSDKISTVTNEHGFYMLNLGTLHHGYSNTTTFEISVNGATQEFKPDSEMGSTTLNITAPAVPEFSDVWIGITTIFITTAVLVRLKRF